MGIRTTVTLDEDVLERIKQESRSRGIPFKQTLNDLLRTAMAAPSQAHPDRREFRVRPLDLKFIPGLNYDDIGSLLEYLEGPEHK